MGRRRSKARLVALVLVHAALFRPISGSAQSPPSAHWSYELLEALDIAGVSSAWMVDFRPTNRETVRRELRRVVEGRFDASPVPVAWSDRFDVELPSGAGGVTGGEFRAEVGTRNGDAYLNPGGGFYGAVAGAASLGSDVSVWGLYDTGSTKRFSGIRELGLTLPGPWSLGTVVGRQHIRSAAPGGSPHLIGGRIPLDAIQLVSVRQTPFPGLGWLFGPVAWQFALAPWGGVENFNDGMIGVGSAIAQPHPRFRIGATRVARFGGADRGAYTATRLGKTLLGVQNDPVYWDDQLLELSVRWRFGLVGLPLAAHLVLTQDDSPLWKEPGIRVGAATSVLSGPGIWLLRYEYQAIGDRARWCPGCESEGAQAVWYRHVSHGEYARDAIPMGTHLGGYGAEHRLNASFFPSSASWRTKAWTFFQVREELNLLEERWPGDRLGIGGEVAWMPLPGYEMTVSGEVADGPEIEIETGLWVRASVVFPNAREER